MTKPTESVINCRNLSGPAPLWMLYQSVRESARWTVRLVVSHEDTARHAIGALEACGVTADLDPIGAEFHIICRGTDGAGEAVLAWLRANADPINSALEE